jgi:hypothetical protein
MIMETNETTLAAVREHQPWNKGKLIGQKLPLQPKHVWAIRSRLQLANKSTPSPPGQTTMLPMKYSGGRDTPSS